MMETVVVIVAVLGMLILGASLLTLLMRDKPQSPSEAMFIAQAKMNLQLLDRLMTKTENLENIYNQEDRLEILASVEPKAPVMNDTLQIVEERSPFGGPNPEDMSSTYG